MSLASSHDKLAASSSRSNRSSPRAYIPPPILNELRHLDLSGRVRLKEMEVVGVGAYGDVLKSRCEFDDRGEVAVAVKRLRFYLKEDIEAVFHKEIYVWSKLKHDNVLALLGFVFDESSNFPLLISEWMANGSSLNYVKHNSDCDLIHLVTGIAEGLAYLHENSIVHSDIKPENIVVSVTGEARICDFGGSRIAAASKSVAKLSTGIRGTSRYLSYELVAFPDQYSRHTKESDVWAFGMTIFALIAQEHPFALHGETQVLKAITDREVPSFNFWTPRSWKEKSVLHNVCDLCWDHDPRRRAVISFIASFLRDSGNRRIALPLDKDKSERGVAKRHRVLSCEDDSSSGTSLITDGIADVSLTDNEVSYGPLVNISSNLDALYGLMNFQYEAYQYLHAAMKLSSSLYDVFVKEFEVDRKLDHLMHAIRDALALITLGLTDMTLRNGDHTIKRLLQQIIECFLFINNYSRKNFEDRKLGSGDGRKMSELISFFVIFKEAVMKGIGALPTFTSSRVTHAIDELALRQRLNPSEGDTKNQQQCLLGTRVEVQKQIIEWALAESSQSILWLHGVAGSGKSTVIASIAEYFRGMYRLGAFLRFVRGTSDPSTIICSLAFKLASFESTLGSLILTETERDRDIANASFSTQFEKLLLDPLTAATDAQQGPVFIILDALDECGTSTTRKTFMPVFLRGLRRLPVNFKFLITSRREQDIDRAFKSHLSGSVTMVELDYTSHLSHKDVRLYLAHEIRNIIEDEDIPEDGSLEKQLSIIGDAAGGLFISASTIVNLVSEHDYPLEKLAEMASNVRSLGGLDQLYSTVLINSGISWHDSTSKSRFQCVIGLILLSKTPLTENTIDEILGPSVGKCRATLSRLRSVIDYRPGEPVRLFHTSFSDYLISASHKENWFIDISAQESFLALRCFDIMREELRFNICNLSSSFIHNDAVDDIEGRIKSTILPHVSYACSYWAQHLCETPYGSALIEGLSKFLHIHLLYWLEVMSLLKNVGTIGPILLAVTKWAGNHIEITEFLKDARRLINVFALPISRSVPHIYLSMLPLTATESKVSAHYLQHTSSLVHVIRRGVKHQSPLLKLLEGHTGSVNSVDFSPDGSLIVSGSDDGTVRIWDTERGEPFAGPFEVGMGNVFSATFSPNGTRIVVGGESGITVLDVESRSTVVGPIGYDIRSVAISPDGKYIISASSNEVNIWDLENGTIVDKPLIGHTNEVLCVAYSHSGRFIVLGSMDKSVRVWDLESRRLVREPFSGHLDQVNSVSFSSDERYVASGSSDHTVRIWDMEKGEVDYSPLIGHLEPIRSVVYSSDGSRVVSGSMDSTVRIWNSKNGHLISGPFRGHTREINTVAFSPDGTRIVSGSIGGTLRTWDAESGKIDSGPKIVREFESVRFSLDGSCVISDYGATWCIEDGEVAFEGSIEREHLALSITSGMQFNFKGTFEWDLLTGNAMLVSNQHTHIYRIADSPNGKRLAIADVYGGSIRIWDKERDVLVCRPFDGQGGEIGITALIFSPNGRHVASGSDDVRLWDAETGNLLFGPFPKLIGIVYSIAYSPNGRYFSSANDDTFRVWDGESGHYEDFEAHTSGIRSISFSPNSSHIVSCSGNYEIKVWSTSTSKAGTAIKQGSFLASSNVGILAWTLDQEGWIRGAHGELLLWVPPDIRPTLWRPRNVIILNVEFSTELDFSSSALGEHWHKCFHPLA